MQERADPGPMPRPDIEETARFWAAIAREGEVREIRALHCKREGPRRWYGTSSGYVDHADGFLDAVEGVDGRDAEGVYVTLNPVAPALLSRAANHWKTGVRTATQDGEVARRRHLLVDVDPVRPTGISATAGEREAALAARDAIAEALASHGWPAPAVTMMSGNGGALIYRVDLPNDAEAASLVERVLKGIGRAFDTPAVTVDTSTHNAARLCKIPGTVAAKGDHWGDRPWSTATASADPEAGTVGREQLELVAGWAGEPEPTPIRPGLVTWERRDVRALLGAAGVGFRERAKSYGTVFELDRCLDRKSVV